MDRWVDTSRTMLWVEEHWWIERTFEHGRQTSSCVYMATRVCDRIVAFEKHEDWHYVPFVMFRNSDERSSTGWSDIAGAMADVSRAVRWFGDDADLLCMRAMLRLEERDAPGCLEDAVRASEIAPTAVQPWRVRALVNVVLDNADAALAAADMVVNLSAAGDPDALNHRAYIRGLAGRDLPAALADIDRAIGATKESSPEMLDTRGFLLHLVGRHEEAVDQLNLAITAMQQNRRKLGLLAGRVDPVQLACRVRGLEHGMAVMLHHRAMSCRAVGLDEQAKQDFEQADRKGFDPTRGIF